MATLVFAAGPAAGAGGTSLSGGIASFIPLILLFIIGYFIYKRIKNKSKDLPLNSEQYKLKQFKDNVGSGSKLDKVFNERKGGTD